MRYLFYVLLVGYGVVWLGLLVHCICRRRFFPILGDERKTRWLWLASFVFVNPLMTLLYLVFGAFKSPAARPKPWSSAVVVSGLAVIGVLGFVVNFPGLTHLWMEPLVGHSGADGKPIFHAEAARIEAENRTESTSAVTSSDNTRFACRRIVIVNENHDGLLRMVADDLAGRLADLPHVEQVAVYGGGRFPPDGQLAPDVYVRLRLQETSTTNLPYARQLKATLVTAAGLVPWASRAGYIDHRNPPLLRFDWQETLHHKSSTTGYESQKHSMAAKNIAEHIGGELEKSFSQWRDKFGPMPELPAAFYGTFRPAELPGPLRELGPQKLFSYFGLLKHNESFWRLEVRGGAAQALKQIRSKLAAEGWRDLMSSLSDEEGPSVLMQKGDVRIKIFRPFRREPTGVWIFKRADEEKPRPITLYAHYQQRLSDKELAAALEKLFSQPAQLETLAIFEHMFDQTQRQRFINLLEQHGSSQPSALMRLAEHYEARKQTEKARRALERVKALLWSAENRDAFQGRIRSLAEKLGDEKLADRPPDPALFEEVGFIKVSQNSPPTAREVGLDEPVGVYQTGPGGEPAVLTLRVVPSDGSGAGRPYKLKHMCTKPNIRSWGSDQGDTAPDGRWRATHVEHDMDGLSIHCKAVALEAKDRFRIFIGVGRMPADDIEDVEPSGS
jgi:hypothetical protein